MKLLTLKVFDNPYEAHLLRSKLESEGIESFIFDENIVTLNPLYNITVGGIKVKIKESDFDRAMNIVTEVEKTLVTDDNNDIIKCPGCGSHSYYTHYKSMKNKRGIIAGIFSFLFGVFPLFFKTVKKCKLCGKEFS